MSHFYLVTDAMAEQVEAATGMRGRDTPLGALIEAPPSVADLRELAASIDRMMHPNRCTCGAFAIVHRPGCPAEQMT